MRPATLLVVALAALALFSTVQAAGTYYHFDNAAQQARYDRLTRQLRCLVCQGESIADSGADLAKDLRDRVHDMIMAGRTDRQIIDFMVDRYGDFVLYRPPVEPSTWLLWGGPFLLLVVAVLIMLRLAWRSRAAPTPALSDDERRRLDAALRETDNDR